MSQKNPDNEAVSASKATEDAALNVRAQIFSKASQPRREEITFNGVKIEILQPSVGRMQEVRSGGNFIVSCLIQFAVLPGTETRVFDDADYDSVLEMPYTSEMNEIGRVVTELFNIKVDSEVKN